MSGDYTRFTFRPKKDYSAVLKQQGRVDLDADFNELIEIVDRRWRSETIDIVGRSVVPSATPDAFFVTLTAMGAFDLGIGRMYVDGIQVENHGLPPDRYLPHLGELGGTLPVPYSSQPYLPAPLPPPLAAANGTSDLVYLDVWQREVTVLEDPSLREVALGGPDTTTRLQSVWQVRVLQEVGDHGCGDAIAAWDKAIAPSAGRLTTSTVAPPASDDPCIISPSGGYRGLENRLYRVEIHSIGPIGGATPAKFKWSRNNATIASPVAAIPSSTQITVQQLGRDRVLRFEIGNWIEITDDFRELQGLPGHLAKVTAIDEANRVLTFTPALPAAIVLNPADLSRHTRVRRWDEAQNVDANGLLDVAAGPIEIEDGIRVTFSLDPANGSFHVGDHWVFSARTADGSVEPLLEAPPRGILHHFCRLGFIHWGADLEHSRFVDCREHWPPAGCDGCCTVTVGDGVDSHGQFTDIQKAIDALGNRGGVVCIGRGFYTVTAGLVIDETKRNVILRGMGPATRIFFAPGPNDASVFLDLRRTEHVRIEDVFVVAFDADALVRINDSQSCAVKDCILVNVPARESERRGARAVDLVGDCSDCEVVHNALLAAKAVACTDERQVSQLLVRDNQILATEVSVLVHEGAGVEILHNQMRGLPLRAFPGPQLLDRGTIDRFQLQVSAAFRAAPALNSFQAAGILIYAGNRVVIAENLLSAQVAVLGFLLLDARIERNDVLSLVGVLVTLGARVKVNDNFVLGVFAGMIQAGLSVALDCTANDWVGRNGIVFMSRGELVNTLGPLLGKALASIGFTAPDRTIDATLSTATKLGAGFLDFGVALLTKVHRNVFFASERGIYKTDAILSLDLSIIDNTFSLCSIAGIELGGPGHSPELLGRLLHTFNFRHLVQGNSLTVKGKGIVSSTAITLVEQNSVQCSSVAIELDAGACTARNNFLFGLGTEPDPDAGLITLHARAGIATIAGNRLESAPGHGILIFEDIFGLDVDDNHILVANFSGIATRNDAVSPRRLRISRNRLEACAGGVPAGPNQFVGALVIGGGEEVRLLDNSLAVNVPVPVPALRWSALHCESVKDLEVSGNSITDNAFAAGGGGLAALRLDDLQGAVRVQGNVVRGNGGAVLLLTGFKLQGVLVQGNHLSRGRTEGDGLVFALAESLLFAGNQCVADRLLLYASQANVSGNAISVDLGPGFISGAQLVVNANSVRGGLAVSGAAPGLPPAVIVTSNLTDVLTVSPAGAIRAHNVPAP